jgi:hypothetical protein
MKRSRRAWLAIAALLLTAALVALAWRVGPEVLMFGGIVAVAAWGFGRHTRVKSHAKPVEAAVADDAPAAEHKHLV